MIVMMKKKKEKWSGLAASQHDLVDNAQHAEAPLLQGGHERAQRVRKGAHEAALGQHTRLSAVSRQAVLRHIQLHRNESQKSNRRLHVHLRRAGHR